MFKHFALRFPRLGECGYRSRKSREMNVAASPEQIELLRCLNLIEKRQKPGESRKICAVKLDSGVQDPGSRRSCSAEMAECRKMLVFSDAFPDDRAVPQGPTPEPTRRTWCRHAQGSSSFSLARKEIPYISTDFTASPWGRSRLCMSVRAEACWVKEGWGLCPQTPTGVRDSPDPPFPKGKTERGDITDG